MLSMLGFAQLVDLAESHLSGKIQHIPDNMYDLDADWEIDPKSLTLMEKIGMPLILCPCHPHEVEELQLQDSCVVMLAQGRCAGPVLR